jgi:cell division septum initiation protein DivIVA
LSFVDSNKKTVLTETNIYTDGTEVATRKVIDKDKAIKRIEEIDREIENYDMMDANLSDMIQQLVNEIRETRRKKRAAQTLKDRLNKIIDQL